MVDEVKSNEAFEDGFFKRRLGFSSM